MKKNAKIILAFFMSGLLFTSGCGASDSEENTEEAAQETTEETENTDGETENTEEEIQQTDEEADTDTGTENADAATQNPGGEDDAPAENPSPDASSPQNNIPSPSGTENAAADIPSPSAAPSAQSIQAELLAGEKKSVVGIITDATRYSVAIQVPDGNSYYLTIPETGVSGNLNYITIGQMATLTYAGSLDSTALLVGISDSSLITGIYVEEYAFAIKIINAVKTMDMKALSDLTNFPVFLDTGNYNGVINTSGEFEAINNEKIFTEALVSRIVNYNLFDLAYTDAGFVMGSGTPNITFDVDDDGILGIIGINCPPAKNTQENEGK